MQDGNEEDFDKWRKAVQMARVQRRAMRTAGLAGQNEEEKKEEFKEIEVIPEEVSDMEASQLNSISMNDNEQIDFDRRGVPSR